MRLENYLKEEGYPFLSKALKRVIKPKKRTTVMVFDEETGKGTIRDI